ncbi:MAG TPA: YCF48-related protein [Azospirillum sp.]
MSIFDTPRRCKGFVAACLLLLSSPAASAQNPTVADLLEAPAHHSARATNGVLLAIARADRRLVAVGERGVVLLSDDDGRNWRQAREVPVSVALTGVTFVDARRGWAIGHSGAVLHTADGGETWTRQIDGRAIGALAVAEARSVVGEHAARIQRDAERLSSEGPDKPLLGIHFADAMHGWVVGAYGLALATTDGGTNWSTIMGRIPNPGGRHLYSITPIPGGLLIAGEQGSLFRSVDGGASFTKLTTPYPGTFFGAVPVKGNGVVAYGLRGNVWYGGVDGGWTRIELGKAATLTGAVTLADGRLLLADEGGRLFRGGDDGRSFAVLRQAPQAGLSALVLAADGVAVVTGLRGARRIELSPSALDDPK